MDPLAIATGLITLASVISEGLKKVQDLHDAPTDIHTLANEVADLDIVTHEVVRALQELGNNESGLSAGNSLSQLLARAQKKLLELDAIVNRVLIKDTGNGKVKYARLAWLRQKSRVEGLRKDLAGIKLSLSNVLEAANS